MATWHSTFLAVLYQVLGWFAFSMWSISSYPQRVLNYRRKRYHLTSISFSSKENVGFHVCFKCYFYSYEASVVGLNFDFVLLNFTKHSTYLIYNAAVFFSPVVQRQYREKYGADEMIPVALNDVAFSTHAVLLTIFSIVQILIYDRGDQRVSRPAILISASAWFVALVCLIMAIPSGNWLWLASAFNAIQLTMTAIKYIPQAWMNFRRKSTVGWSITAILLDLSGGIGNILQMVVQSIDQHSVKNLSGNFGKLALALETIAFDIVFILQHYLFCPEAAQVADPDSASSYKALPPEDPEDQKESLKHNTSYY